MLVKKESKSDGETTEFAYVATSRPAHMPHQLLARLSGIRSIFLYHGAKKVENDQKLKSGGSCLKCTEVGER